MCRRSARTGPPKAWSAHRSPATSAIACTRNLFPWPAAAHAAGRHPPTHLPSSALPSVSSLCLCGTSLTAGCCADSASVLRSLSAARRLHMLAKFFPTRWPVEQRCVLAPCSGPSQYFRQVSPHPASAHSLSTRARLRHPHLVCILHTPLTLHASFLRIPCIFTPRPVPGLMPSQRARPPTCLPALRSVACTRYPAEQIFLSRSFHLFSFFFGCLSVFLRVSMPSGTQHAT